MDRSTMASLNTYNTRIYLTRLVKIVVPFKFYCTKKPHPSIGNDENGIENT